jgi:hypothetical protein
MVGHNHVESERSALVVQVCRLHFADGQVVSAQIEAPSLRADCPVHYAGPYQRLPYCYPTADLVLLRALFQSFARELDARFEEESTGSFDLPCEEPAFGDESEPPAHSGAS